MDIAHVIIFVIKEICQISNIKFQRNYIAILCVSTSTLSFECLEEKFQPGIMK